MTSNSTIETSEIAMQPQSLPQLSRMDAYPAASKRLLQYLDSFKQAAPDYRVYASLPSSPWFDPAGFPIVPALEDSFPKVREEVLNLPDESFQEEIEPINRKGTWEVLFFYEGGRRRADNCARCPTIANIIEQHETVRTCAGLIYLSRMRPGTHIAAHRGPTNMRLRCHLGIQIPQGDCRLRVDKEIRGWSEGKCIVFDDYFEHEAWNLTETDRIVLIVDLWHPALTVHEREILKGFHNHILKQAEGISSYWGANRNQRIKAMQAYY